MTKYILALDQGTSSSRAILFDKNINLIGIEQIEFPQYYPKSDYVEHNPFEILQSQLSAAQLLLKKLSVKPDQIAGIGITNQRETIIMWDKKSGQPIYNAIVWQDKRTSNICEKLKKENFEGLIKKKTGLVLDSYFSATKIQWILDNVENARKKAENGEILFGTVDTWLVWNLTNGEKHITDYSNASRTLLFDIHKLRWDDELLKLFNIPKNILPKVVESSQIYGQTSPEIFGKKITIAGLAGDQQAALFGQNCIREGLVKNTYGTGCFMLMNTGEIPVVSKTGLVTTIAWSINGKVEYALEGSVFIAGAAIKWLRDSLHIIELAEDTERISMEVSNSEGIYVVPAFSGLGAPYWDQNARGAILGLNQAITYKHIVRSTLESLAYQSKDIIDAMIKDSQLKLSQIYVDGKACSNNFLMQFQADILGVEVLRPKIIESTALGAAFLAGLSTEFWTQEDILKKHTIERVFSPKMDKIRADKLYKDWLKAVKRTMNWID